MRAVASGSIARARAVPVGAMVGATLVMLAAGFALQLAIFGHGGHTSISDLPRVVLHRGIGPGHFPYLDRVLEYPVAAGFLLYGATLVAPGPLGVLVVTAVAAAACCVGLTVVFARRYSARAWRWALGAGLLLYTFQNWDVFAIGALVVGLFAYERHRETLAGTSLGVGAAVKLFPAVLIPPLVALRLAQSDRRGALRLALGAVAGFGILNLPILVLRPAGWWWTYAFQSRRQATWGTAWFYGFRLLGLPVHGAAGAQLANRVSLAALVIGVGLLTVRALRGRIGPAAIAVASIAIFLLANKVYSPTYDLWLLPCFVILPLSRRLWLAFCAMSVGVFLTVYGYFHGFVSSGSVHAVLPVLVAARVAVLVFLVLAAWRAPCSPVVEHAPRSTDDLEPAWAA